MKKSLLLCCLCLFLCSPAWGGETGLQMGLGGTYAIQNLDPYDPYNVGISYGDAWGMNFRLGGKINEHLGIQADFDYIQGFEWKGNGWLWGTPVSASSEISIFTIMTSLKLIAPVADNLDLYCTPGVGVMVGKEDISVSIPGFTANDALDSNGACAKIAAGIDLHLNEQLGFFVEGGHVWGFGDLDRVRYGTVTTGILLSF